MSSVLCDTERDGGNSMELSGEGQLGVRERVCTRGQWAWNRLPRALIIAPNCQSSRRIWITPPESTFGPGQLGKSTAHVFLQ